MNKIGKHSSNFIDMTGWKMWEHGVSDSRVIVVRQAAKDTNRPKNVYWMCECSCGSNNVFVVEGRMLRSGNTLSCGCVKRERHPHTHGECHTKLYMVWSAMRKRCNDKNNKDYARYGGRGIRVCDEWNESYESFRDWANGSGYSDGLEIDRINNDWNYEPSNCRWSTHKEQCNNRSTNIWIEYNGERKWIDEWCKITGLSYRVIYSRYRNGWSAKDILGIPYKTKRKEQYEK